MIVSWMKVKMYACFYLFAYDSLAIFSHFTAIVYHYCKEWPTELCCVDLCVGI